MNSLKVASLLVFFNALLSLSPALGNAGQAKHGASHRRGDAATLRNSGDSAQGSDQWLADPERGWVRRNEILDGAKRQPSTPKRHNQGRGPIKR